MTKLTLHKGERVKLTCKKVTVDGVVEMISKNGRSVMVNIGDDVMPVTNGTVSSMVPLLLKDDGQYYDLFGQTPVRVEHITVN